jgi:hypothetical protein
VKNSADTVHSDLWAAQKIAYNPSGFICENFVKETESEEYGACTFKMNNLYIKFRVGKITPTKIGQFVTLWKRIGDGPIQPHDLADSIDFFVVSVRCLEHFGQFVFPKAVLYEQGVVSKEGKGGKRAMRVYPSWDVTDNRQAKKTQAWQLKYFFKINPHEIIDIDKVQKLFS